ncbi:hypothetical protein THIOKS12740023 [Thiocapsa sp. KS1]|nr:hypothetical protein THIOKS12740023 [Thiocapsa sp. KS1]
MAAMEPNAETAATAAAKTNRFVVVITFLPSEKPVEHSAGHVALARKQAYDGIGGLGLISINDR